MERRRAIQSISLISAGFAFLPACSITESLPIYENIPLEVEQYKLVEWLTRAILPAGDPEITTPETTSHFALTMINDCYAPMEIQKYLRGLKLFNQYILDRYQASFESLNPEQQILLFTEMSESNIFPKSLKYFLNTTKQLTVQHFTSSEYFLVNHLEFEFVPGRFRGCVALDG